MAAPDVGAALTHMENAMQYALVNGEKREASRDLIGLCQGCNAPMIPKCGPIKAPHWAHKTKQCDSFWEPEKPWHRAWKELFPANWREVRRYDANGECHIADIRTEHGLVIECQHSSINAVEVTARERFYRSVGEMVWLIDGARYKRGLSKFLSGTQSWRQMLLPWLFATPFPDESFPETWLNSTVPVIFDFGVSAQSQPNPEARDYLWCLLPDRALADAVIVRLARLEFVAAAKQKAELFPYKGIVEEVVKYKQRGQRVAEQNAVRMELDRRRAWSLRRFRRF